MDEPDDDGKEEDDGDGVSDQEGVAEIDESEEQELLNRLKKLDNEEKELDIIHSQLKAAVDKGREPAADTGRGVGAAAPGGDEGADSEEENGNFTDDLASARLTARSGEAGQEGQLEESARSKPGPAVVSVSLGLGASGQECP